MNKSIYDFQVETIDGKKQNLEVYKGEVLLIVNTASKCGYTPQYEGLEKLYSDYKDKGFAVLGFPCNQFKGQEPGTNKEIEEFCKLNYDVQFPLFSKIDVNGENAHPLYQYLKANSQDNADIRWNFTKFLIDKNGNIIKRYEPAVTPAEIENDIKAIVFKN
ncbi:MAG: glutathione peroxidase [Chloroherpetonaceae bacterium]|nr:glutathione peroxidase [Bacteroidota bacterium]